MIESINTETRINSDDFKKDFRMNFDDFSGKIRFPGRYFDVLFGSEACYLVISYQLDGKNISGGTCERWNRCQPQVFLF